MKRGLTIGLAIAALGTAVPFVSAGSSPREPVTAADAIPAYEVLTTLREMGLNPSTRAVRRGPYYVLHAIDPLGVEMRVVADAEFGDILSVVPARPYDYPPYYRRAPRIIEVPQSSERYEDDAEPSSAPRRTKPRPKQHSEAPPAPVPQRPVLSAPPPRAEGPSPIYPTPKFENKPDDGEKFGPPEDH